MLTRLFQGASALLTGRPAVPMASPAMEGMPRYTRPVCPETTFCHHFKAIMRRELGIADDVEMIPMTGYSFFGEPIPMMLLVGRNVSEVVDVSGILVNVLDETVAAFDADWSLDGTYAGGEDGDVEAPSEGPTQPPLIYASDPAFHTSTLPTGTGVVIAHWQRPSSQSLLGESPGATDDEIERVGLGMPPQVAARHHFAFAG